MFNLFRPNVEKLKEKRDTKGLIKALKNKDSDIRRTAARALGEIGDPRAVEPLVKAFHDENGLVKLEAIEALGRMREHAFDPLVQALKHEDLNIRREAARNLGAIKDARAVGPLTQTLTDEFGSVRSVAIGALAEIGDEKAVESLIQVPLGCKYEEDRKGAVEAIVKIGKPAVELLIGALRNENAFIRSGASKCLGRIMDLKAVEPLIQILKDEVPAVRKSAVCALAALHSDMAVELILPVLISDLKDRSYKSRDEAVKALREIGGPAVEALIPVLKYEDENVRAIAARTLGGIGDARAVEPLIKALKDKSSYVQGAAVTALCVIGELTATEAVIDWLFQSGKPDEELLSPLKYTSFLGDYKDLIIQASAYHRETKHDFYDSQKIDEEADVYRFSYDLKLSDDAIQKLCNIRTKISSNILHKVAQKKNVEVANHRTETMVRTFTQPTTLSFESQREMAKKELELRGNPPYDPSAYLSRETWKIK